MGKTSTNDKLVYLYTISGKTWKHLSYALRSLKISDTGILTIGSGLRTYRDSGWWLGLQGIPESDSSDNRLRTTILWQRVRVLVRKYMYFRSLFPLRSWNDSNVLSPYWQYTDERSPTGTPIIFTQIWTGSTLNHLFSDIVSSHWFFPRG